MQMIDPLLGLVIAAAIGVALVLLFWPRWGFFWRALSAIRATERVRIEDALKHLYDCEYRRQPCTSQSLSGAMGLRESRSAELLDRLQQLELVSADGAEFHLTDEGRAYALRVIRIHRLWERYLILLTHLADYLTFLELP